MCVRESASEKGSERERERERERARGCGREIHREREGERVREREREREGESARAQASKNEREQASGREREEKSVHRIEYMQILAYTHTAHTPSLTSSFLPHSLLLLSSLPSLPPALSLFVSPSLFPFRLVSLSLSLSHTLTCHMCDSNGGR